MIGKKLLASRPVGLAEVKEILKERSEGGELTYEQTLTNDYVKKFAKLPKTRALKLLEELKAVENITEELAIKIADVLPKNIDVLKLLVPKNAKLSDESLENILKLVKQVT